MPKQAVKRRHEVQKVLGSNERRERCLQIPLTADVTTQLTRPREPATHSLCGGDVRAQTQELLPVVAVPATHSLCGSDVRAQTQELLISGNSYANVHVCTRSTHTRVHRRTLLPPTNFYASQKSVHARTNIVTYKPPCSYT